MAQATLDQKEHDMLLVSQGRSLLGVSVLILSFCNTCSSRKKPLITGGLLHSWIVPLNWPSPSPATGSCSLVRLCDMQCSSSPRAPLAC